MSATVILQSNRAKMLINKFLTILCVKKTNRWFLLSVSWGKKHLII